MEITKNNFVSARFCDNERTQIEVFVKGDKENEVFPHIVELDENHPDYKNLLTINKLGFDQSGLLGKRVYSIIDWKLLEK